jgi:hypothetical protein
MTELPPAAARLVRALELEVLPLGLDAWRVTGGAGSHLVTMSTGCDCPDRAMRGPTCKHELAVMLGRADPELRAAVLQMAQVIPDREEGCASNR